MPHTAAIGTTGGLLPAVLLLLSLLMLLRLLVQLLPLLLSFLLCLRRWSLFFLCRAAVFSPLKYKTFAWMKWLLLQHLLSRLLQQHRLSLNRQPHTAPAASPTATAAVGEASGGAATSEAAAAAAAKTRAVTAFTRASLTVEALASAAAAAFCESADLPHAAAAASASAAAQGNADAAAAVSLRTTQTAVAAAATTARKKHFVVYVTATECAAVCLRALLYIWVLHTFNVAAAAALLQYQQHQNAAARWCSSRILHVPPLSTKQQLRAASRCAALSAEKQKAENRIILLLQLGTISRNRSSSISSQWLHRREDSSSSRHSAKCSSGSARTRSSWYEPSEVWRSCSRSSSSSSTRAGYSKKCCCSCCSSSGWRHRRNTTMNEVCRAANATAIDATDEQQQQQQKRALTQAAAAAAITTTIESAMADIVCTASVVAVKNIVSAALSSGSLGRLSSSRMSNSSNASRSIGRKSRDTNSSSLLPRSNSSRCNAAGDSCWQRKRAQIDDRLIVQRLLFRCAATLLLGDSCSTWDGASFNDSSSGSATVFSSACTRENPLRSLWLLSYVSSYYSPQSCSSDRSSTSRSKSSSKSTGRCDSCCHSRNSFGESNYSGSSTRRRFSGCSSISSSSSSFIKSSSSLSSSNLLSTGSIFRKSTSGFSRDNSNFNRISSRFNLRCEGTSRRTNESPDDVDSSHFAYRSSRSGIRWSRSRNSSTGYSSVRQLNGSLYSCIRGNYERCRSDSRCCCCCDETSEFHADAAAVATPVGADIVPLAAAPMMEHTDRHWRKFISLMSSHLALYSEMLSLPATPEKKTRLFFPSPSSFHSYFRVPLLSTSYSDSCDISQWDSERLKQQKEMQQVVLPLRCRQQLHRETQSRFDVVNPVVFQIGTNSAAAAAAAAEQLLQSISSVESENTTTDKSNSHSLMLGGPGTVSSKTVREERKQQQQRQRCVSLHMNLNCGCPSARVASGGFGLTLMEKPASVASICNALYSTFYRHLTNSRRSSSSSSSRSSSQKRWSQTVPLSNSDGRHSSSSGSSSLVRSVLGRRQFFSDVEETGKVSLEASTETDAGTFIRQFTVSVKCRVGIHGGEVLPTVFGSRARISPVEEQQHIRNTISSSSSSESRRSSSSSSDSSNIRATPGHCTRLDGSSSCRSSYIRLANFIHDVASQSPVRHFIVHARPGILINEERKVSSLSPQKRRRIAAAEHPPALLPHYVYQLCTDFPSLRFSFNGGVTSFQEAAQHLIHAPQLAGIMVGRGFVEKPWYWASNADKFIASVCRASRNNSSSSRDCGVHGRSRHSKNAALRCNNESRHTRNEDLLLVATTARGRRAFVARCGSEFGSSCRSKTARIAASSAATQRCSLCDMTSICCSRARREVLSSYAEYADRAFHETLEALHYCSSPVVMARQYNTNCRSLKHTVSTATARRDREIAAAAACEASAILKPLWNMFSGETGGKAFRRLLQLHSEGFRQHIMEQLRSLGTSKKIQACSENAEGWQGTLSRTERDKNTRDKPQSLSAIISRAAEAIPDSVLDGTAEETAAHWEL